MKNHFYITTPLYYPNDDLHIGHAYSTIIADIISRYKRLSDNKVTFLTGSDEHGEKIEKKANSLGITPKNLVDKNSKKFKNLWEKLDIKYDIFERTTNLSHINLVQKIFKQLLDDRYIYHGKYNGYYCTTCESYYTKSNLNGLHCKVCGSKVYMLEEESYFLKVTDEIDFLKKQFKKKDWLMPVERNNELIKNFIDNDITDLSLTRTKFNWGVPIKKDAKEIIYVWFDALIGYLSGIEVDLNEKQKKNWNDLIIIQILGKEITRFHCVYWPIILKYLGLNIPYKFISHGWIINSEGKMSKSKGNVINPLDLIKIYGSDAIRFYFISQFNLSNDAIYDEKNLKSTYNFALCNLYGNLISRVVQMNINSFGDKIPLRNSENKLSNEFRETLTKLSNEYINLMEEYQINEGTNKILEILKFANKYIDVSEPWKKSDKSELGIILNDLFRAINNITIFLSPIIPQGIEIAKRSLGIKESLNLGNINKDLSQNSVQKINIFPRIK